jgi:restriction endonuclease S subunit
MTNVTLMGGDIINNDEGFEFGVVNGTEFNLDNHNSDNQDDFETFDDYMEGQDEDDTEYFKNIEDVVLRDQPDGAVMFDYNDLMEFGWSISKNDKGYYLS